MLIGHRGACRLAPENTIDSVIRAFELGFSIIEIDVQITADNHLVIHHDLYINDSLIADITYDDILKSKATVPTLYDILWVCLAKNTHAPKVRLLLDVKVHCSHRLRLINHLSSCLYKLGNRWRPFIAISSFDHEFISEMYSRCPQWTYGLLFGSHIKSTFTDTIVPRAIKLVVYQANFVDASLVNDHHTNGRDVYVYTVNNLKEYCRLRDLGVDGIITDNHKLLSIKENKNILD